MSNSSPSTPEAIITPYIFDSDKDTLVKLEDLDEHLETQYHFWIDDNPTAVGGTIVDFLTARRRFYTSIPRPHPTLTRVQDMVFDMLENTTEFADDNPAHDAVGAEAELLAPVVFAAFQRLYAGQWEGDRALTAEELLRLAKKHKPPRQFNPASAGLMLNPNVKPDAPGFRLPKHIDPSGNCYHITSVDLLGKFLAARWQQ